MKLIGRETALGLALACSVLLLCLAAGEITVRLMGRHDVNGNFVFRSRLLKPYKPPARFAANLLNQYKRSQTKKLLYDPDLGWVPPPDARVVSGDVHYDYNTRSIRSAPREYEPAPPPGVLRIALFGDSFTHCDEVLFDDTWGHLLEEKLGAAGIDAEVLNFGVGGYGMDQAFLRYRKTGAALDPRVVILGFQALDVKRNVNIIRALITPRLAAIPFSKPRFVLEGGALELINAPALSPDETVRVLTNIGEWGLRTREFAYDTAYDDKWFYRSRLLSLVATVAHERTARQREKAVYLPDGEPARLTLSIIDHWRQEVEAAGGLFLVAHLPAPHHLEALHRRGRLPYTELLAAIERTNRVIRPEAAMLAGGTRASIRSHYIGSGHFSPRGNDVVAEALVTALLELDEVSPLR